MCWNLHMRAQQQPSGAFGAPPAECGRHLKWGGWGWVVGAAHISRASWFKMSCHKSTRAAGTLIHMRTHTRTHMSVRLWVVYSRQLCITPSILWSLDQVESWFGLFYAPCNCGSFACHTSARISIYKSNNSESNKIAHTYSCRFLTHILYLHIRFHL